MKYLFLPQAMPGMRVIMTDEGLILKSPAGSAHYDLKGRRHTVWGDASFFPEHLSVKDKRKTKPGRAEFGKDGVTVFRGDGSVAMRLGNFDSIKPLKSTDKGKTFISDTMINRTIHHAQIAPPPPIAHITYSINIGQNINIESILENALKNAAQCAAEDGAKTAEADKKKREEFRNAVRHEILLECLPGGVIHRQIRR